MRVRVRPSVFSEQFIDIEAPALTSISGILEGVGLEIPEGLDGVAWINGRRLPSRYWHRVRPKPGAVVGIAFLPRDGRTALLIGGALALTLTAGFAAPLVAGAVGGGLLGSTLGGLVAGGILVGGTLALNAIMPPPDTGKNEDEEFERSSIGSVANQLRPWDPVPVVCGRRRVVPPFAARPYSLLIDGHLHSHYLFAISCGLTSIEDPKFGDTPIDEFDDILYEDFGGSASADPHDSITLFDKDVSEERISVQLTRAGNPYTRFTPPNTKKIIIIFHAPSGPYFVNSNGETRSYAVEISARYRLVGSGSAGWTQWLNKKDHANNKPSATYWDHVVVVTPGSYEVEITRNTGDNDDQTKRNDVIYWLSMVSIQALQGADLFPSKVALVALRVRDQGSLGEFNCIAHGHAPVFESGSWTTQATSNPASCFRRVLQWHGLIKNVSDAQLDLPALQDWYTYCKQDGLEFNGVFDRARPVREVLDMICVRGRATFDFIENKYSVIVDRPSTEPVSAMITARNLQGLSVEFATEIIPQVLRVRFADRDNGWEPDERLVYDDGYNVGNADFSTAVVVDLVDSVSSAAQAWREGRWWLAQARLRRQRVSGTIGLEHLLLRRGSKVAWQHWASLIGIGPGLRIRAVNGNPATQITVDQPVLMTAGNNYGVRIRHISGVSTTFGVHEIVRIVGHQTVLTFANPVSPPPDVDDLVAFGILLAETSEMIVLAREPMLDGATIVMTNAAPAIASADTGVIPPWDPNITTGVQPGVRPATPEIIDVAIQRNALVGHPDVLRSLTLVVTLARYTGRRPQPGFIDIRLRESGSNDTWRIVQFPGSTLVCKVGGVQDGITYEIQAQALGFSSNGQTLVSAWSARKTIRTPRAGEDGTPAVIAKVRNLQLLGQGNDTEFGGRDPTLTWSIASGVGGISLNQLTGGVDSFVDPSFGYYEVEIYRNVAGGKERRRLERTHEPKYTYSWSKNVEDAQRLGQALPVSAVRVGVTFVDKFKHRSNTARILISNPPPAAPSVTVTAGLEAVFVTIAPPSDADFAGIIVWASTSSSFTPSPSNQVARTKGDIITSFKASAGQLFVRVAAYDEFRDDPAQLNISSAVGVTVATAAGAPLFQFDGLTFTANAASDTLLWDDCFAIVSQGSGGTIERTVAAGSVTVPLGDPRRYVYYIIGSSLFRHTADIAVATGVDRVTVAAYGGGARVYAWGDGARASFLATDLILANTIGAGLIVTDQAVITETAQIANSIITRAKIGVAAIDSARIEDLSVGTLKIDNGAVITSKIGPEAATSMRDFYSNGAITAPGGGGYTDLADITISDALNLPVAIIFSAKCRTPAQNVDLDVRILRNSTSIFLSDDYIVGLDDGATFDTVEERFIGINIADRSPGNGSRTYTVQGRAVGGDMFVTRRSMLLIHHKR